MSCLNDYGLNDQELVDHLREEIKQIDKLAQSLPEDASPLLRARLEGSRQAYLRMLQAIQANRFRFDLFVDATSFEDFLEELYDLAYREGYSSAKIGNSMPISHDNGLQQKRREHIFNTTWRYRVSTI